MKKTRDLNEIKELSLKIAKYAGFPTHHWPREMAQWMKRAKELGKQNN